MKHTSQRGLVIYGVDSSGNPVKVLVASDGTVKVDGSVTISGTVDISDRFGRQLGQVDIERYLGSLMSALNPLHTQTVVSGAVIDPRTIRALVKATDEVYSVLRTNAGVAYDARDRSWTITEALARSWTLGATDIITAYGSQTQALLQRAATYDSLVQLRHAGAEIDPRSIRALTSVDNITAYGSLGALQQRTTSLDLYTALRQAGSELSTSNPLFVGVVDALGNRLPSMDVAARKGFVGVTDGTETLSIDASNRAEVAPFQTTRGNLTVKSEREDLIQLGGVASPSGAGVEIVPGVANQFVKVYDASYEGLVQGLHYFYHGTSTVATTRRFMVRAAATAPLPAFQTFTQPQKGNAGDGLYLYSANAESSMPYAVHYVQEA